MELEIVHPLTARWLTEHGYTYEHEVKMPEYGRADFVAKNLSGEILIVECKESLGRSAGRSLAQVLDYCRQYGQNARPAIAAPQQYISENVQKICDYYGAMLIRLDDKNEIEYQYLYRNNRYDYISRCIPSYFYAKSSEDMVHIFNYRNHNYTRTYIDDQLALMFNYKKEFAFARDRIATDIVEIIQLRKLDLAHDFFDKYIIQYRSIIEIWWSCGLNEIADYFDLNNQIWEIAIGRRMETEHYEFMLDHQNPPILSVGEYATLKFTERMVGLLHEHRVSYGKQELSEDIDDVRPIIDAARPEIDKVFSKKPHRLAAPNKLILPE